MTNDGRKGFMPLTITKNKGKSQSDGVYKIIEAVETNGRGGIKRVYFDQLEDYSSREIGVIFEKHISKEEKVRTEKWTGYSPLKKEYDITQVKSDKENSVKELHTIIHQVKSWLRSTYYWVHKSHLQKY